MNHSEAGPSRSTMAQREDAERDSEQKQHQQKRDEHQSVAEERQTETPRWPGGASRASPTALVAMLDEHEAADSIPRIDSGVAKMFRKLRDQTSSKNVVVTPCMTRTRKSQSRTAPRMAGTKLMPDAADACSDSG